MAKKGIAAIILAKAKPEAMKDGDEEMNPLDTAAEEVIEAIESKDPLMLRDSLKAFIDMCREDDSDEDME